MNAIWRMLAFVFPLITFPYVSRVLGVAGYGEVSFATAVIYYFTTTAALGIPTYGIRACTQCRDNREALSRTVHELLILSSILTVLAYLALGVSIAVIPQFRENAPVLWVSSSAIVLSNISAEWFYQAIEQYHYITIRNVLFKILSVIAMFLLVRDTGDTVIYAGVYVLGTVGSNILNLFRLRRYIFLGPLGNYNITQHLRPVMGFFLLTVATTIYTNLDTVMLGFMTDDTQVGFYSAAVKMKNILVSAVTALGVVLLPRASYYIQNQMHRDFRRIIQKSFQVILLTACPLTIFCMMEAENILLFLSGAEYLDAVPTMRAITPAILLIGLSNVTGIQVLVPMGKEKYTVISTAWGAVTDLVLNLLLIPRYGALGAAIGTLAAEIVVLVLQVWFLRKEACIRQDWRDNWKVLLAAAVAAGALWGLWQIVFIDHIFAALAVGTIVFLGIYGMMLLLTKESLIHLYLIQRLKQFFRRKT